MEDSLKKKRTNNFNEGEEKILISLVKKYQDIVESKKTDSVTNSQKLKTWAIISNEYNTICGGLKSAQTLRTKFNNLKKNTKKKFAAEKRIIRCTGGGPPPPDIRINDAETELRSMMGHTLTGFVSKFDDDQIESIENAISRDGDSEEEIVIQYFDDSDNLASVSEHEVEDQQKEYAGNLMQHSSKYIGLKRKAPSSTPLYGMQDFSETINFNEGSSLSSQNPMQQRSFVDKENQDSMSNDWSSYTPAKLQQKKSSGLKVPKRNSTSTIKDKISTWALSKADLVDLQKRSFEEEHKLKMIHMREKHQLFVELQREEWNLKKTHMIEIHKKTLLSITTESNNC